MRVLFILSQRPELTGSGITLDALVRESAAAGHEPWVLCGAPADKPAPTVGGLPPHRVFAVTFGRDSDGNSADVPFAMPGMSDVMPYASTVWSSMTDRQLALYRHVWRRRLAEAVEACRPDVVHCNHLWLVGALVPGVLEAAGRARGRIPSLVHCHATGLRQMALCPHLRDEVIAGLRRHDCFLVPHADLAGQVATTLSIPASNIIEVGAGYRQDLFHTRGAAPGKARRGHMLYVGKYAAAKGLPWLLGACETLWKDGVCFTLHVAGDGAGPEAEALRARMTALAHSGVANRCGTTACSFNEGAESRDRVFLHGRLDQADLSHLMRRAGVTVLPSLYEGLPLVLVEARACGCRLVCTALSGIVARLAPTLGADLILVQPPRLVGPDTPVAGDLPAFTRRLAAALRDALDAGPAGTFEAGGAGGCSHGSAGSTDPRDRAMQTIEQQLEPFTWNAVYRRAETVWQGVVR